MRLLGQAGALALVLALAVTAPAPASAGPARPAASSFAGKVVLVALQDKTHAATRDGRQLWGVYREASFTTAAGDTITLPAGMVTDLASIPRLVSNVYPPDGPWVRAAVFHDLLYATHGTGIWHGRRCITRAKPYTREEADDVLRQAMAVLHVPTVQRVTIWAAVRVGGAKGWGS